MTDNQVFVTNFVTTKLTKIIFQPVGTFFQFFVSFVFFKHKEE